MTLFDDRITRQSGRSGGNVMLDNITSCVYCNQTHHETKFWVLRFETKKIGFVKSLSNLVTETAIADTQVFEKVTSVLRARGIPVSSSSEND